MWHEWHRERASVPLAKIDPTRANSILALLTWTREFDYQTIFKRSNTSIADADESGRAA
jgi:hypothetical protein